MDKNKFIYEELKKIQQATGDTKDGFKLSLPKLGYGLRNKCIIFSYNNAKIIYKIPLDCLDEIIKKFSRSFPKDTKIPEITIRKQTPVSQVPKPDYLNETMKKYLKKANEHLNDTINNLSEAKNSGVNDLIEYYEKKLQLEKSDFNEKAVRRLWNYHKKCAVNKRKFNEFQNKYNKQSWCSLSAFYIAEYYGLLELDITQTEFNDFCYIIKQDVTSFEEFVVKIRTQYPEYFRKTDGLLNSKAKNQHFPPYEIRLILKHGVYFNTNKNEYEDRTINYCFEIALLKLKNVA